MARGAGDGGRSTRRTRRSRRCRAPVFGPHLARPSGTRPHAARAARTTRGKSLSGATALAFLPSRSSEWASALLAAGAARAGVHPARCSTASTVAGSALLAGAALPLASRRPARAAGARRDPGGLRGGFVRGLVRARMSVRPQRRDAGLQRGRAPRGDDRRARDRGRAQRLRGRRARRRRRRLDGRERRHVAGTRSATGSRSGSLAAEPRPVRGAARRARRRRRRLGPPARRPRPAEPGRARVRAQPPRVGRARLERRTSTSRPTATRTASSGTSSSGSPGATTSRTRGRRASAPRTFDRYPKGTSCFLAPRALLLEALAEFDTRYADLQVRERRHDRSSAGSPSASGSTSRPSSRATYIAARRASARSSVTPSIGEPCSSTATDGRSRGSSRPSLAFFPVSAGLGVAALRRPWLVPALGGACAVAAAAAATRATRSRYEIGSFAALAPVYAVAHGAGMWRGLALAARDRIARAS